MSNRDHHKPAAVVIGLDSMTGLQTARILSSRGIPVIGLSSRPGHPCARTRVCQRMIGCDTSGEGLVDRLLELADTLERPAVLFPCSDWSVLRISRRRDELLGRFLFGLPDAPRVEEMADKPSFFQFARSAGLPVPATFLLRQRKDVLAAADSIRYPCILKPALKTAEWERRTQSKAFRIANRQELVRVYDQCEGWTRSLVLQEWVSGEDGSLYSCNAYLDRDSNPLAAFVARKIRQWPPETGTSCLGQECRDDEVLELSLRFFKQARIRGLAYLEIKRDSRSGVCILIEPNIGRPTGRSAIAEAGGVELLQTAYCDLAGLPLPDKRAQAYGNVKWVHLRRDLQSALHYWRRGDLTLAEWWRSWRGPKAYALFSWGDPAPFCWDLLSSAAAALGGKPFFRQRSAKRPGKGEVGRPVRSIVS